MVWCGNRHRPGRAGPRPLTFPQAPRAYCNSGIDTLGRVIEVASGQPFEDFLSKRIFQPVGMKATTFYPDAGQPIAMTYGVYVSAGVNVAAARRVEYANNPFLVLLLRNPDESSRQYMYEAISPLLMRSHVERQV